MDMYECKTELRWHQRALEHALKRRAELVKRWGRSLNHRELLQEFVERLDEDMRWHEGRMRELGEAAN